MAKILLLNGPNLNMLGTREPEVYGKTTLADITKHLEKRAAELKHLLVAFQSNAEFQLIEKIQTAKKDQVDFIIINPGAFTHTSIALRDAFLAVEIPFIEVHLSNVYAREAFRCTSYLSDIAIGVISGFKAHSYELALQAADHFLNP